MRTIFAICAFGAASMASAQHVSPPTHRAPLRTLPSGACHPSAGQAALDRQPNRSRKLGDQPPASHIYAVYRLGRDGCPDPIVLRDGIGANPERQLPSMRVTPRMRPLR